MKVLVLTTNTTKMASPRLRTAQYAKAAAAAGIHLDIRPFLDPDLEQALYIPGNLGFKAIRLLQAAARRLLDTVEALRVDLVYVLREAALFGPPLVETLAALARPVVFDLDDAIWVPYSSPTYGRLATFLKMPAKASLLCRMASAVIAGNDYLAAWARRYNRHVEVIPTVVDTDSFVPRPNPARSDPPMVGWIGSHSTTKYIEEILPALRRAMEKIPFKLKLVGGRPLQLEGLDAIQLPWSLEREIEHFQSLDIGLYPMFSDQWAMGKSALKAVQYGAVGIPTVATPTGAVLEVVQDGLTGLVARSTRQWTEAVVRLLEDESLRRKMGQAARRRVEAQFSLAVHAPRWIDVVKKAARRSTQW